MSTSKMTPRHGITETQSRSSSSHRSNTRPLRHETLFFLLVALTVIVILQIVFIDFIVFGNGSLLETKSLFWNIDTRGNHLRTPSKFQNETDTEKQQRVVQSRADRRKEDVTVYKHIEPLDHILRKAGANVTEEILKSLPEPTEVEMLYGNKPVLTGLEGCRTFQDAVPSEDAFIAPAGLFNTGTNLMTEFLQANCHIPEKVKKKCKVCRGMREQVPWGKHSPVSWRLHHTAQQAGKNIRQTDVLPVVIIKDPYTWMSSMCRHEYAAHWFHAKQHCPNLVPLTSRERKKVEGDTVPVTVRYSDRNQTHHASLVGLWNDWYEAWEEVDFPRLIVRFEDLLFWPEEIVKKVCECGGGEMMHDEFKYIVESAKESKAGVHKGSSGMVGAMIKYSNATKRKEMFRKEDLEYARTALNEDLMNKFNYRTIV